MDKLMIQFESVRIQMVERVKEVGLQHPDVIKLSQTLDSLHNSILRRSDNKTVKLTSTISN